MAGNELARTIARRAEVVREQHDFMTAVSLFDEALSALQGGSRRLRRWCLAHRAVAYAGLGAFGEALEDLDAAESLFAEEEKETDAAYTWWLAQRAEVHRLSASHQHTPASNFERYCKEVELSTKFFRAALRRDPHNPWICSHFASAATLAYWYGFSRQEWRKPIEGPDFPSRQEIRELYDRGLAGEVNGWWARTYQVIYYVVEHPADFTAKLTDDNRGEWVSSMRQWWSNYELAMDYAKDLESMGMRSYAALSGRALATAYGLAWHDSVARNLELAPNPSEHERRLLRQAQQGRTGFLDRAMRGGLELLRFSPEDLFGNLVLGSVLRSRGQIETPSHMDALGYLGTLRRLSVVQTFLTSMLLRSTEDWRIKDSLSESERQEFDEIRVRNQRIWEVLSNDTREGLGALTAGHPASPTTIGLEHDVVGTLMFPS